MARSAAVKAQPVGRTWLLVAGGQRLFEMTLPLEEAPDWDPPLQANQFKWEDYQPVELYFDGKLAASGESWNEVLLLSAKKLRKGKLSALA